PWLLVPGAAAKPAGAVDARPGPPHQARSGVRGKRGTVGNGWPSHEPKGRTMTSEAKAERLAAQIASGIGKTLLFILTLAILAGIGLAVRELGGLDYAKTLIDYQRIAGRYERPIGPGSMEFRTDGTVLEQAPLAKLGRASCR